ncbi:MAG TPA: thymidine phosphorylase [Spirochaetia bacterium]|nr:thymidine phosphorylase [Spirochaetales bacterium]HRY79364.1 thymidine phosphorylase [Spirochaetia bacterium]
MRAVDLIMKKRDGGELSREEIAFLVSGYVDGSLPEYQVSAWLMSVFFRGMNPRETADLTELMLRSGDVMDLSGIPGPFVDKHSTGGVGDKVSLILAPIAAACGVKVPMMSGRALGHTGGTLDKLESIPGYRTNLSPAEFRDFLRADGYAMTGQTARVVPADKKLYALRDVTATVESVPLITASILSKKVAEGAESLVFDVKCGPGAFMKTFPDARRLAESLVDTGKAMGKRIVGVITDMTEPLGLKVGNFLEVEESLDCLTGKGPADLMEVTYRLAAWMLVAAGKAKGVEEALRLCEAAVAEGRAMELFRRNVRTQGGDLAKMDALYGKLRSPHSFELRAPASGFVTAIDAYRIGLAGVYLGVGRNTTADPVYPDVGFVFERKVGDSVTAGDLVARVYGKDEASLAAARPLVEEALTVGPAAPAPRKLVLEELAAL